MATKRAWTGLAAVAVVTMMSFALAGCGGKPAVEKVVVPDTPDGAANAFYKALGEDKPQVIWSSLPPSYQKQITEVKNSFAEKMDKDLWDKSLALLGKTLKVARDKQDFILGHPMLAGGPGSRFYVDKDEFKKHWPAVVNMLDTVVNSEIKTLDGIKNLDVETFLGTTGTKLMQNGRQLAEFSSAPTAVAKKVYAMKTAKVTLVNTSGDTATLKVEIPDEKEQEVKLVKVEGRWIPEETAKGFDAQMKKAKDEIAKLSFNREDKAKYMTMLGGLDGAMDSLLSAKDQDEFNAAATGVMLAAMGGGLGGPPGLPGPDGPPFDGPGGKDFPDGDEPKGK